MSANTVGPARLCRRPKMHRKRKDGKKLLVANLIMQTLVETPCKVTVCAHDRSPQTQGSSDARIP